MRYSLALPCLLVAALAQAEDDPLAGPRWVLAAIGDAPPAAEGREPANLLFDGEGTVYGFGGCNSLRMGYEVTAEGLAFQAGPMTLMACPDPIMAEERALIDALTATDGFEISGALLTLTAGGAPLLVFEALDPETPLR